VIRCFLIRCGEPDLAAKPIQSVVQDNTRIALNRRRCKDDVSGLRAAEETMILYLNFKNQITSWDAHADLDAAVLDAYGFSPRKDLLKQLLDLNLAVARVIDKGETVTAPGVPLSYGNPADLITDDCIQP
jgi:hypothetical protein